MSCRTVHTYLHLLFSSVYVVTRLCETLVGTGDILLSNSRKFVRWLMVLWSLYFYHKRQFYSVLNCVLEQKNVSYFLFKLFTLYHFNVHIYCRTLEDFLK